MESSSSADQREEEEERHPLLHSPCHFVEQLITSCLKCLGLDHHYSSSSSSSSDSADDVKTKADHHQQYPPPQTEMEMKLGEEGVVTCNSHRYCKVDKSAENETVYRLWFRSSD
ncbi:hypothetical protein ACLB2K_004132 [Fragaria x ananassa]